MARAVPYQTVQPAVAPPQRIVVQTPKPQGGGVVSATITVLLTLALVVFLGFVGCLGVCVWVASPAFDAVPQDPNSSMDTVPQDPNSPLNRSGQPYDPALDGR